MHDPSDPVRRLLFNVLAMVAEFETDLIRLPTREGMRVAKAMGRLRGKQPKLNPRQEAHLVALHRAGEHSTADLGDLFGVARSTVYRAFEKAAPPHDSWDWYAPYLSARQHGSTPEEATAAADRYMQEVRDVVRR